MKAKKDRSGWAIDLRENSQVLIRELSRLGVVISGPNIEDIEKIVMRLETRMLRRVVAFSQECRNY